MMGTGDGKASSARSAWRWDVALSFAGAQRDYVEQVAQALKARGVRCFYDADEQVRLWGTHLAEELPRIYARESAAVVVFISADYAGRPWTRLERRAALVRAVAEAGAYVLPARFDDSELPGLLPDVVSVDLRGRSPQQFAAMIVGKLAALGITGPTPPVDAENPAWDVEAARPAGAVRVSEADPRRLGVHAAISVPGVPDETLPEYVPRDVDNTERGVQAKVAAAARRGGFVLLVGGSSVGKTRCGVEAVQALLPEWWLVHPAGPDQVAALTLAPMPHTVVWLDELQRYLDGEHGLTGGVVRALLNPPNPAVIISTLWPELYAAYAALPDSDGADPHAREREVLDLAAVIRIGPAFSPAEQDRARAASARDPRLAVALKAAGYGLTQTLAAAPQLVARWQDAQTASPYGWAVLTAALDVARLGARAPMSADLLRAAAAGYCTSRQLAEAPGNWFEQALAYATRKVYGAVAPLSRAGKGMGQIAGYIVADYLIQHASQERRHARVPASSWDAALSHLRDPADAARLAESARNRLLYRYAIPLYGYAADAGEGHAALRLADLLAERGDLAGLQARADGNDGAAASRLADLLAERGDLDRAIQIMRARADVGDRAASARLAGLQARRARRGNHDLGGDAAAVGRLAGHGDVDGLRALADAGDGYAASQLAGLLARRGDVDELRARADAGDGHAAWRLAHLLAERGHLDQAVQIMRARADAGDATAAARLADLLAEHGDVDGLRARADAGDGHAAWRLAYLLASRGDVDGLRARADAGDDAAASRLADLLASRGDLDRTTQILRARADAGDAAAASQLAGIMASRGDVDGLRARADAGDDAAAWRLAYLLASRGDVDGLRARADAGDDVAASRLADLLASRSDLDGLRARAGTGDKEAAWRLAGLMAERGDVDGLRARADAGDGHAASRLADLLASRGDLDRATQILRARADAGDGAAAVRLAGLLAEHGRGEEAERLRRFA